MRTVVVTVCTMHRQSRPPYQTVFIQTKEMYSRTVIKTSMSIRRGVRGQMRNVFNDVHNMHALATYHNSSQQSGNFLVQQSNQKSKWQESRH